MTIASASLTCTGSYTVTQADIDTNGGGDGDIDNTVTADSNETDPDDGHRDRPARAEPRPQRHQDGRLDDASSVDAAGDVIHYTITVANTGNTTLTGVTVDDPLLSDARLRRAWPARLRHDRLTIAVGGSLTYTGTYTVTQADIDNDGGGDGDIDNTVTADSNETDPDTASATVPLEQSPEHRHGEVRHARPRWRRHRQAR